MAESEEKDNVNVDFTKIKSGFNYAVNFLKQKKILNIIIISLLILILVGSFLIRTQNLPLLKDQTNGETIPLALDPHYFLRVAQTIVDNGGSLPEFDEMRYPAGNVPFTNEILPWTIVGMYNLSNIFGDYSINEVGVISTVIFFVLGLIAFFFLTYSLTNSKITALISSTFLAVIPTYLYRTMAGFADHEAIGMFAFFLILLGFSVSLKFLNKEKNEKDKKILLKTISFGLLIGALSVFTILSWGGIAKFVFLIVPFSFIIFWIFNVNDENRNKSKNHLIFYITWFLSTILISGLFGMSISGVMGKYILSTQGLISLFVLAFIIIDYVLLYSPLNKNLIPDKRKKYRILYSLGITLVLGILFLILNGRNISELISKVFENLVRPFGESRVGQTVAENRPPYLNDWVNQIGDVFFWLFFGGLVAIGIRFSNAIKDNKKRVGLVFLWIIMISGIIFSRSSSGSILNGNNFLSHLIYFAGIILFFGYLAKLYFAKQEMKFSPEMILVFSWMIFMLIAARGAIRFFFFITPFACFSAGLIINDIFKYVKDRKDELLKMIIGILAILILVGALFSLNNFVASSYNQAKNLGPSANAQWQKAMQWVRENTPNDSIFLHWWDYGYWLQSLGERRTVADGGHAEGSFQDHLNGRYVLTTPNPDTALSYMKSHNVSHLLIDSSDLGKYGAYSKIGSGAEGKDRYSTIPTMFPNPQQSRNTENTTTRLYQGAVPVDRDIVYNSNGSEIFLPRDKALIAGILLKINRNKEGLRALEQPKGIFIYNNEQIYIPLRYVYANNQMIDFGGGLNATAYALPTLSPQNNNMQIDPFGSMIYLSPKVSESLFAQLYLMNDPFNKYPTIGLAHRESDPVVNSIKAQGGNVPEFIYYNGVRGPIKIWDISYSNNIIAHEELTERDVKEWGSLDNLQFSR